MDESAFQRELKKYRIVRARDFVDSRDTTQRTPVVVPSHASPGAIAPPVESLSATALVAPTPDFWKGFDALLQRLVPNKTQRDKVVRAFDEVGSSVDEYGHNASDVEHFAPPSCLKP